MTESRWIQRDHAVQISCIALRIALAAAFLSAVADRFGLWGAPGAANVAWGNWPNFMAYIARLNWFLPAALIPAVAWVATVAETVLGLALLAGIYRRVVALASALLLFLFGIAMTLSLGVKSPLNDSVFSAACGALVLGVLSRPRLDPAKEETP